MTPRGRRSGREGEGEGCRGGKRKEEEQGSGRRRRMRRWSSCEEKRDYKW